MDLVKLIHLATPLLPPTGQGPFQSVHAGSLEEAGGCFRLKPLLFVNRFKVPVEMIGPPTMRSLMPLP